MITLEETEKLIYEIAKKINAPVDKYLTIGDCRDDATPCIRIDRGWFYYFARDRDVITVKKKTHDINKLLYWVFDGITSEMRLQYQIDNRIKGKDTRRQLFPYQLNLLKQLDENWYIKKKRYFKKILRVAPFEDEDE